MSITTLTGYSAAVLAQILSVLSGVSGVVNARIGEPVVTDWPKFLAEFRQADGTIQGWLIVEPELIEEPSATRESHVTVKALIRGLRSVQDSAGSRAAFQVVAEAVMDAFRNVTLGGQVEYTDPVVSRLDEGAVSEDRMFGDTLCHVAELAVIGYQWLVF